MPKTMTRALRVALALTMLAVPFAGCGDDDPAPSAARTEASATAGAFPVTLEHAYGTTTIPSEPERVVTIGFNEDDFVLALGVKPVGVRDFIGTFDEDERVWARDLLGGETPEKIGGEELDLEKIAALRPDLIMGVYSYIDEPTYEKLSQIAPTVAPTKPDAADRWQDQTLITGRALGREEQATKLVERVEERFAQVREEHPEFEGKTLAYALGFEQGGNTYSLEQTDLRTQLFTALGFELPKKTGPISRERLDLIDVDVLVTAGATEEQLLDMPVVAGLDVVKEGRVVHLGDFDSEANGAIGYSSPLSLPRALEIVVPKLAEAVQAGS